MAHKDGFTLIELLVVLAIIGILAAIAIPQYAIYKQGALDSQAKSDLHNMATAMEAYYGSAGTYAGASVPAVLTNLGYRQSANVIATGGGTATGYTLQATPTGGSATGPSTRLWGRSLRSAARAIESRARRLLAPSLLTTSASSGSVLLRCFDVHRIEQPATAR